MKKIVAVVLALAVLAAGTGPALAQSTLEKINQSGTLTITG